VATEIPIGSDSLQASSISSTCGVHYEAPDVPTRPRSRSRAGARRAQEYREKLLDEVAEVSDELMERYLEGAEISHEEIVDALKRGTNHGSIFRSSAASRRGTLDQPLLQRSSKTCRRRSSTALRDRRGHARAGRGSRAVRLRLQDPRRPFAGRINLLRVYQGTLAHDTQLANTRSHAKERIGS